MNARPGKQERGYNDHDATARRIHGLLGKRWSGAPWHAWQHPHCCNMGGQPCTHRPNNFCFPVPSWAHCSASHPPHAHLTCSGSCGTGSTRVWPSYASRRRRSEGGSCARSKPPKLPRDRTASCCSGCRTALSKAAGRSGWLTGACKCRCCRGAEGQESLCVGQCGHVASAFTQKAC